MTESTKELIRLEIRNTRASLTNLETWWQGQPVSDVRTEQFRRINFFRNVWRDAEKRLDGDGVVPGT